MLRRLERGPIRASSRMSRMVSMTVPALALAMLASCGTGATEKSGAASSECDPSSTGPGVSDSAILLGATMPLSGSAATGGTGVRDGQEAYYTALNKAGGIKGRKVELKVRDDAYDPSTAQEQMRQLVEGDEIFAVSGGYGTPGFLGVVPYLERKGVPAIAPYAPSAAIGNMEKPHIFTVSVNYIQEFQILTDHIIRGDQPKKLALVAVAGDVGDDAKMGMERAVEGKGIELTYIPETPGTTDFTPIAVQLKRTGADWVAMLLTPADTGGLLRTMDRIGYAPKLATWQGMADEAFIKEFGALSQNMLVALETAPLDSPDPAVRKFVQDFTSQTGKRPTTFNQVGWAQAQVTAHALEKAEGLSRGCLITALEGISEYKTGILPPITWGENDRAGVDAVGIGRISGTGLAVVAEPRSAGN
jgi:branched-chain amino acid transport system substrate-binding protein